ncbi:hypothetical protein AVEN_189889-1 [Araneus ventricosus]|uniref:Uncharacterized protein n=1 Tax=Araneus ventricosus TaxID=182803 RepID=A0A4Y2QWC2_ARAVE|nr:hypothetical protein AVEN_189889-1 [Araneus ventricosus]
MRKRRYFITNFPTCSKKNRQATSAGQLLEIIDCIFQKFQTYSDESYGKTPQWILHNMTENNKNIFGPRLLDIIPCASTLSQEPSSPVKEKLNCFPRKRLKFDDKTNKDSETGNIGTKTAAANSQESAKFREMHDRLSRLAEDAEIDAEMEINLKERLEINTESEESIRVLMRGNSVQIRSMSIIRESEGIGVEIDICMLDEKSSEKPEQGSVPSGNTSSPWRLGRKTKLPYSSPSENIKSSHFLSVSRNYLVTIDYSDPAILYFLTQRLLSILSYRKMCMEQIHNCFKTFLDDASDFNFTIKKLKSVVEEFPRAEKGNSSDDLKMHNDLINKARKMSEKAQSLIKEVNKNITVLKICLIKIDDFGKEQEQLLSTNNETILTISDLKRLELRLNEICKQADSKLILLDRRTAILLNLSSDFQWLIKHFVKFLIITGILKPPPFFVFGNGKEK